MKLLLITPEYPPDHGGIAAYLGALFVQPPCARDQIRVHKIPWLSLQTRWLYPRWLPALFSALVAYARWRPDLICVSHILPMGTVAYLLARFTGADYLIFLHGTDILQFARQKNKGPLIEKILNGARTIFVNSQATKELFEKTCGNKIIVKVLYPGICAPPIDAAERNNLRKKYELDNTFNLIFLGRLIARKGADRAVLAVARLIVKYPNLRLYIIGAGPEQAVLADLTVKLKLSAAVRLLGPINEDEKWAWLFAANCLVFPYHTVANEWEGLGISVLEAQAAGCPIIATAQDGLREAFLPNVSGIALAEGTIEELVEAIERLIQDSEMSQKLRQGALNFSSRFSTAAMRKNFDATIHSHYA